MRSPLLPAVTARITRCWIPLPCMAVWVCCAVLCRYDCPRCLSRLCERNPSTSCAVCGIRLAAPSHLARSYHHLFPVPMFDMFDPDGNLVAVGPSSSTAHVSNSSNVAPTPAASNAVTPAGPSTPAEADEGGTVGAAAAGSATATMPATVSSDALDVPMEPASAWKPSKFCFSCMAPFAGMDYRFRCPKCYKEYCGDCDALIHDALHNCPGCC